MEHGLASWRDSCSKRRTSCCSVLLGKLYCAPNAQCTALQHLGICEHCYLIPSIYPIHNGAWLFMHIQPHRTPLLHLQLTSKLVLVPMRGCMHHPTPPPRSRRVSRRVRQKVNSSRDVDIQSLEPHISFGRIAKGMSLSGDTCGILALVYCCPWTGVRLQDILE